MNWKRQWPILLLWIVMSAGGTWGLASTEAGKPAPPKPVVNQLSPQEQALFDAVKAGDKDQVKKLIADGVDVNCHYADGFSPAHVAILRDDVNMLSLLEAHGLDTKALLTVEHNRRMVNMCDKKLISVSDLLFYPLVQVASAWGSARCTKLLLQTIPKDDWKVSLVCTSKWPKVNSAKPSTRREDRCNVRFGGHVSLGSLWNSFHLNLIRSTALSHGCGSIFPAGRYSDILEWVEQSAPQTFDTSDKHHLNKWDIIEIARTIAVMIDERVTNAETAGKLAHSLDTLEKRGASLDTLMKAADLDLPLLKALTRRGYNPSPALLSWVKAKGSTECIPYYETSSYGPGNWLDLAENVQAISWILEHGGQFPDDIMLDASGVGKDMVKFLSCIGTNIDVKDKDGRTRLIRECYQAMIGCLPPEGQIEFIQSLVDLGVNPNIEDKYGWRAMDYLFCQRTPKPIIALLRHGADVSHTEKMFSYSVISYLIEEYTDLAAQFSRYHFTSPFNWDQGKHPLSLPFGTMTRHRFQWRNAPLLPFLQLLIKNGADVNFVSNNGLTPLMEAAMMGRMDVVVLLVEKGGDIGMKARKPTKDRYPGIWTGKTAIELTAKDHPEIRDYLKIKAKGKKATKSGQKKRPWNWLQKSTEKPNNSGDIKLNNFVKGGNSIKQSAAFPAGNFPRQKID